MTCKAQVHLETGARTVLVSAVANDADVTIVLGVNDDGYDPVHHRIVERLAKVFGWYDDEWDHSCRLVDLVGRLR